MDLKKKNHIYRIQHVGMVTISINTAEPGVNDGACFINDDVKYVKQNIKDKPTF